MPVGACSVGDHVPDARGTNLIRFVIDCIKQAQDQVIFRNIRHRIAVVLVTDMTFFVDHHQRGDTAQFKQIDFLSIKIGDHVFGVGQTEKRQAFIRPIAGKGFRAIGANC
jgi:hypothetical protein